MSASAPQALGAQWLPCSIRREHIWQIHVIANTHFVQLIRINIHLYTIII